MPCRGGNLPPVQRKLRSAVGRGKEPPEVTEGRAAPQGHFVAAYGGSGTKSLFKISPHTSWRRIFRPDFVKNPCNPPGLRRLFALLDKKSPRQSPHAEILNRLL